MIQIKITDKERVEFLSKRVSKIIYKRLRVNVEKTFNGIIVTYKDEERPDLWSFIGLKRAIEIYKGRYQIEQLFIDQQNSSDLVTSIKLKCSLAGVKELLDSIKLISKYQYLGNKIISIKILDKNMDQLYIVGILPETRKINLFEIKAKTFYLQVISKDILTGELLTGILFSNSIDLGLKPEIYGLMDPQTTITLKKEEINDFFARSISVQKIEKILLRKGYRVKINDNNLEITNPIFRKTTNQETILDELSDFLVDRKARYSLNELPRVHCDVSRFRDLELRLKKMAAQMGFSEIFSNVIMEPHSISKDTDYKLRKSLLEGLLDILKRNKGKKTLQIFEGGHIFKETGVSRLQLAFLKSNNKVDINEMMNIIYSIMSSVGIGFELRPNKNIDERFIKGRHFDIYSSGVMCGKIAELHPKFLYKSKHDYPVIYGEIDYENIFKLTQKERLILKGRERISGELKLSGSKNATLPIIFAASSIPATTHLKNVPTQLEDVKRSIELIQDLGVNVEQLADKKEIIIRGPIKNTDIDENISSKIRYSILLLSCFAASFKNFRFPNKIGGCIIGKRKIDQHLLLLKEMGFSLKKDDQEMKFFKNGSAKKEIDFSICSTGATENALIYSLHDTKTHIISNAHLRPEIQEFIQFLKKAGLQAKTDIDNKTITTRGPLEFPEKIEYSITGDIDETFSYMVAAQLTGGDITVKNAPQKYMHNLLKLLEKIGFKITSNEDSLSLKAVKNKDLKIFKIKTGPYPEIGSDQVPVLTALAAFINGRSEIKDTRFPDRTAFLEELNKLGAKVEFKNGIILTQGDSNFLPKGNAVSATDIRGGMSVVLTALLAKNLISIDNIYQINRGYEEPDKKLQKLGIYIHSINSYLL